MCGVTSNLDFRQKIIPNESYRSFNLVAKTFRGNDGDLIADSLVCLEIEGELRVVSLNDDLCGLLDRLHLTYKDPV